MQNPATAFLAGTAVLTWLSRKPLRRPGTHGFYRYFSWEAILGLVVITHPGDVGLPVSPWNDLSTLLLMASIVVVAEALRNLYRHGGINRRRQDKALYEFEKTTTLVETGIYRYIRHPMYSSLLLLTWGTFLQRPGWTGGVLAGIGTLFLLLTARADELECLAYFGPPYAAYMQRTRRFIPFVL